MYAEGGVRYGPSRPSGPTVTFSTNERTLSPFSCSFFGLKVLGSEVKICSNGPRLRKCLSFHC